MFTELGPFVVDATMNVSLNPWSWNKLANVIFVGQPARRRLLVPERAGQRLDHGGGHGGGALRLDAHPELKGRLPYIAGESYGGHYVPNTAPPSSRPTPKAADAKINLVGFAVGNGYADWALDFNANVMNGRYYRILQRRRARRRAHRVCGRLHGAVLAARRRAMRPGVRRRGAGGDDGRDGRLD